MLPYNKQKEIFETLVENNFSKLQTMIREATSSEREFMLNGQFNFDNEFLFPCPVLRRMSRPLLVEVITGSTDAVELLIKEGADVFQTNTHRENLFHALIAASSLEVLSEEEEAVSVYKHLLTILTGENGKELLMQENKEGLRPLEMAAKLGCVLLYESIQATPNVYVSKTIHIGMTKEEWIDITEYESYEKGNRRHKSPMTMFAYLDRNIALGKKHGDILQCDIVKMWMNCKLKSLQTVLCSFVTLSVLLLMSFYLLATRGMSQSRDMVVTNISTARNSCFNQTLYFILPLFIVKLLAALIFVICCYSMFIIIPQQSIMFFKYKDIYCTNLSERKDMFTDSIFFLVLHVVFSVLHLLFAVLVLLDIPDCETYFNILVVVICPISSSALLYTFQISPRLGHFTVALKQMGSVLSQFFILFLITYLPYVHSFYKLLQDKDGCANTRFSPSVMEHYYNTFVIILNMVDITQLLDDPRSDNYFLLLLLHVLYVFLVSILLFNFLIALLANAVAEVMGNKALVLMIQSLSGIYGLELILEMWIVHRKLAYYFQRKHFIIHDNRFYLRRVSYERK